MSFGQGRGRQGVPDFRHKQVIFFRNVILVFPREQTLAQLQKTTFIASSLKLWGRNATALSPNYVPDLFMFYEGLPFSSWILARSNKKKAVSSNCMKFFPLTLEKVEMTSLALAIATYNSRMWVLISLVRKWSVTVRISFALRNSSSQTWIETEWVLSASVLSMNHLSNSFKILSISKNMSTLTHLRGHSGCLCPTNKNRKYDSSLEFPKAIRENSSLWAAKSITSLILSTSLRILQFAVYSEFLVAHIMSQAAA